MADNRSDRLDRIEELIEANWQVIKANTDLITRMTERQQRTDERLDRMAEMQARAQQDMDGLRQEIRFLLAAVQGHVTQPHPPAHAGENPTPPGSAGE